MKSDPHKHYKSIRVRNFNKAEELYEFLGPTNEIWHDGSTSKWAFRGHRNGVWKLQPHAWRREGQKILKPLQSKLKPYLDKGLNEAMKLSWKSGSKGPEIIQPHQAWVRKYLIQVAAEFEALYQFAKLADKFGNEPLSLDKTGISFLENLLGTGWPEPYFGSELRAMQLAQHHGIPTRLLDFTSRSKIAAFFAVQDSSKSNLTKCEEIAIWAVNTLWIRQQYSQRKSTLCLEEGIRYQNSYLHVQEGLFLWSRNTGDTGLYHPSQFYVTRGRWPLFEELIEESFDKNQDPPLWKLTLPAEKIDKLKMLLLRDRISHISVMPTLGSVREDLIEMWKLDSHFDEFA